MFLLKKKSNIVRNFRGMRKTGDKWKVRAPCRFKWAIYIFLSGVMLSNALVLQLKKLVVRSLLNEPFMTKDKIERHCQQNNKGKTKVKTVVSCKRDNPT